MPLRNKTSGSWGLTVHALFPTVMTLLLFWGIVHVFAIPALEQGLMNAKREQIRQLAQTATGILASYKQAADAGEQIVEEAQRRAAMTIRALRYGPEGKDYFWICDLDANMIAHPYRPDLEGTNVSDLVDTNDKPLVRAFVDIVRRQGGGYVDYTWQWKDQADRIEPKLSYVTGFEPWGWIVGTGMYLDDVRSEIAAVTRRANAVFAGVLVIAAVVWGGALWQVHRAQRRRDRAEKALRLSRERLQRLAEAAWEGIVIHDNGVVLEANQQYFNMFGYRPEELIGRQSIDLTTTPQSARYVRDRVARGDLGPYEAVGRRKDGSTFPMEIRVRLLEGEDGRVLRVAAIRDMTEAKEAERENERLLEKLAQRNKELQSVLYAATHDLRSPLVNVDGFAGELVRNCDELKSLLAERGIAWDGEDRLGQLLNQDIPESLRFVRAGTRKMGELLDGLMQIARVGRMRLEIEPLDMDRLIREVLGAMQYQIQEKKAVVSCEPLPPCLGDAVHVGQVFSNLLDNALKYLAPDRPGRIDVYAEVRDGTVHYHVRDNGIGIAPDQHGRIFYVFHRLNPTGRVAGYGLGLAIVNRLLDRLDGSIRVESEPGRGSVFIVSLPAVEPTIPSEWIGHNRRA